MAVLVRYEIFFLILFFKFLIFLDYFIIINLYLDFFYLFSFLLI